MPTDTPESAIQSTGARILNGKLGHHASYVGAWLRVLNHDKHAVVPAAAAASKAAAFVLHSVTVESLT